MNSITLTGRLTRDPEMRTTRSAAAVTDFRLAVGRRRGKDGEDRGAVFVDVTCFGGLAESVAQYLEQGRQVAVSGRLELDEWETEAGERRSRHSRPQLAGRAWGRTRCAIKGSSYGNFQAP